ncbi:MAG: hydrogenase maturation protease [Deltaproteobacteria bacterium]|jgi:hydrogenase maturation protease
MIRVVALGSELAGDDAAALEAVRALGPLDGAEVVLAGRPGPSLLEHLEGAFVVLVDVVRRGLAPGEITTIDLAEVGVRGLSSGSLTSHDLGPVEALRLGAALGRPAPRGLFVGVGGRSFTRGAPPSEVIAAAQPHLRAAILDAIAVGRARDEASHA